MEELELIVDRMIKAGEPEEAIAGVVKSYTSGKTSDPVIKEASTGSKEDTASQSEDTFSESPFWNHDETQEKQGYFEETFGKGLLTNLADDFTRIIGGGNAQGAGVNEAFDLYKFGPEMTDEQYQDLIDASRRLEEYGQTDEMIYASQQYEKYKKEGDGGVKAWLKAYITLDNPTALPQYMVQSLVGMGRSLVDSEEVAGFAAAGAGTGAGLGAGGGAAVGSVFAGVGAVPGAAIGAKLGAVSGFMGGLSGAMETSLTTMDLVREKAIENGVDWSNSTDEQRIQAIKDITNNKESFDDLKSKALARGVTIGVIDAATGVVTMGAAKGVGGLTTKSVLSSATKPLSATAAAITESGGGIASEYYGQKAAGQEFNLEEIMIEGFADKTFTTVGIAKGAFTGSPKYSINGETMNGKKFHDAIKLMDDEAYVSADIKVENSPAVERVVNNRRSNINLDQKVDSRINNSDDRSTVIKLMKEQKSLNKNKEGNASRLAEIQEEINTINEKYKGNKVDVTIEQRKQAVAKAIDDKFEASFNKNLKAVKEAAAKKDTTIDVFEDDDAYYNKIAENQNITPQEAKTKAKGSDGVFVGKGQIFINKAQAKKVGAVGVASHEFLHPVLNAAIGNSKQQGKIVSDFKKSLTSKQRAYVDKKLKANYDPSQWDTEYLNIFSDGIQNGDINYDQTLFEKIGESIKRFFVGQGFDNISFDSGRDVYNFLKEYNTSIKKEGKVSKKAMDAITAAEQKTGRKVGSVETVGNMQMSRTEDVAEVNRIYEANEDKDIAGFEIADKYRGMAESTFKSLRDGSNYTNDQKDVLDQNKEDIIAMMLYDKIPSQKETSKARNVVGLVKDFVKEKQKYRNVAAYINTFFKERSKEAFKYYVKDAVLEGMTTEDGTLKSSVAKKTSKQSSVNQGKEARKLTSFDKLKSKKESFLTPALKKSIFNEVSKNIKLVVAKTGTNLQSAINSMESIVNNEVRKIVTKDLGNISKKKGEVVIDANYELHLRENYDISIAALPLDVIKKSYGKLFNLTKTGREKTAVGKGTFQMTKPSKIDWIKHHTVGGYTTLLARQKTYATSISNEFVKNELIKLKSDPVFMNELADIANLSQSDVNVTAIEASIDKLINALDRKKGEAKGFDTTLQFSITENQAQDIIQNKEAILEGIRQLGDSITSSTVGLMLNKTLDPGVWTSKDVANYRAAITKAITKFVKYEDQNVDLSKMILEEVATDSVATNLSRIFNLNSLDIVVNGITQKFKNFGQIFTLKKYVSRQRNHYLSYADETINSVDDVINHLKHFRGHMTSAGKKYFLVKRNQIFSGNQDYIDSLNKILEPKSIRINAVTKGNGTSILSITDLDGNILEITDSEGNATVLNEKGVKAAITTPAQSGYVGSGKTKRVKSKQAFKDELDIRKKSADEAWNNLISLLTYIKKNGSPLDFAMTMMSLKSNMASMLKAAAPVEYYFVGPNVDTVVYEHIIPTEYIVLKLTQHFYGAPIDLNALKDRYKVAIVPEIMDNNINIQRQKVMPAYWNESMHETLRYFDELTLGMNNMFVIESLTDGVKYGENHAKVSSLQFSRTNLEKQTMLNKAIQIARNPFAPEKGISVFDFDDTIARSNSKVSYTLPDGTQGKINATEFALQSADLEAAGATFDFSEFNKVVEGKKGPLFDLAMRRQDKFTSKDIFILTARPQEAAIAIHAFLKGLGLTIPIENITGLADGRPSAKSDWIISKAAEGYNNFYFADDAYKNVKAVQDVLDVIDVKRDVQQAKLQFSRTMEEQFNDILEQTKGVKSEKRFSDAAARSRGKDIGKWKFFLPPSAEDFVGLIYSFLGKGKVGEAQMEFFNKTLVKPFARAMDELNRTKQALANNFRALKKAYPEAAKKLSKITPYNNFTYSTAVRVYIWTKAGITIPGLSKTDIKRLNEIVQNDKELKQFADAIDLMTKERGFPAPGENWLVGNLATDIKDITDKVGRKEFLAEWIANKEVIFSKENLNKIEAIYGSNFREALEDMLYRMENGTNRNFGKNRLVNSFSNWVNNSVGAIMFFNMRSAILQTISFVNFINWSDNNPLNFAKAILNTKQFSKDFVTLFNSDMLKQRRSGIGRDVNESEIAEAMSGARNKPQAILNYLLRIGFTPTQIADSFAISMGGAAFYRNRINTYLKQGMTQEQALDQAFKDFQETTEVSQQSSRPDMISQQQAGPLGRLILAFQNTPMQYTRLIKKAFLDLMAGRGDAKTNMSKILYYGAVQNFIFAAMQSALFAMLFDDDEDEDKYGKKKTRIANTMTDSILRGSGIFGAGISTMKNMILKFMEQEEKGWNADHAYTVIEAANLSPPIGSKLRKLYSGIQTYKFNKDVISHKGFSLDNPILQTGGNVVSAITNIPLDRVVNKYNNLRGVANSKNESWQRLAMLLGWNSWDVDAEIDPELEGLKKRLKKRKKLKKKISASEKARRDAIRKKYYQNN
jgi:hypothetical protein